MPGQETAIPNSRLGFARREKETTSESEDESKHGPQEDDEDKDNNCDIRKGQCQDMRARERPLPDLALSDPIPPTMVHLCKNKLLFNLLARFAVLLCSL